ncbi:D-xylose transport system permease protein [Streptosporangium becharense]|uniref:Xylose transport system permease protein XylH n=1 Tax=Streptosporangium becharense TaxID=1816182 RepID=A0A7W9IIJ6_9ACTN|nr:sugar ABC transporter permease [Streptosporangium becharense]MBB2914673.1 D-xylose transport system permease protein [Streptosporangium becharense]MBB5820926.1 D-xylose transport system permease protein [Streptosporangium becharense]
MSPLEPSAPAGPAAQAQVDPRLLVREQGFAGYLGEFKRRVRGGELGSLPVVVGLVIIWIIFQSLNSQFLSPQNLSNLSIDIVATGLISVGIVFVLLLGEIDLAAGAVSGACAALLAVLYVNNGWNPIMAIAAAVVAGAVLGLLHGSFFALIGVPSFVVTLAGLLAWTGLQLLVLGPNGTINLPDAGLVSRLTSTYFSQVIAAYGLAALATAGFFIVSYVGNSRRRAAGIPTRTMGDLLFRTAVLAIVAFGAAFILNKYKGLPLALLIFLVVVVAADFVQRRTRYGRSIFAVGGNIEAARRAGVNVALIRITVFMISGAMAAVGGVFAASRIASASQATGQSNVLLMAIAAAVIGGTSLFGGRGTAFSALLGMLVIQSIASGMALEGVSNSVQFMVTGAVLLAAVVIDSVSRRSQKASGRA